MTPKQALAALIRKPGNLLVNFANTLAPDRSANPFLNFFHAGHFYSPLPDPAEIAKNRDRLFNERIESLPGIDDNWAGQERLLREFLTYVPDYRPATLATEGVRYFTENTFFKDFDAFAYYGMLRHFKPKKIVEIGSGFTSALALDVSDKFLRPPPRFVFIEPFPDRLRQLLKSSDREHAIIHEKKVQDISPEVFLKLTAGDFLFIDSSHVSKIGSDVNFLFLDILPRLAPGVIIHIHDVFWPFEYPEAWLNEGRSWNEIYLLRGLLSGSNRYRILFFNSFIAKRQAESIQKLPAWAKPGQAASIWLEVR